MRTEAGQTVDWAEFLDDNLPLVNTVIGEIARRHRVGGDALEEFRSVAFLKMVEHDYAVLRRFAGASSLRTYITVVLQRVLLDLRNREWGRWRASAAAVRLGRLGVQLERLVTRDGLTADEAVAALGPEAADEGCRDFAHSLRPRRPARGSRTTLGQDAIPDCLDPAPGPQAALERREREGRAVVIRRFIRDALRALPSQDHLLITLRYRDGLSIADAARVLKTDAKPLYRRIERILGHLRAQLCNDALRGDLARELADGTWYDATDESGWWRPSNPGNGTGACIQLDRERVPGRRSPRRLHRRVAA